MEFLFTAGSVRGFPERIKVTPAGRLVWSPPTRPLKGAERGD